MTVVLIGIGKDGASGMASAQRKCGYSMIKDEKTSVIWGVPRTFAEAGHADEIQPLENIARRITGLLKKGMVRFK